MATKSRMSGNDIIVASIVEVHNGRVNSGTRFLHVCKAVNAVYKGEPIDAENMEDVLQKSEIACGWTEKSKAARRKEYKRVLTVYPQMPDAIGAIQKSHGACGWDDSLAIARHLIDSKGKLKPALAAFNETGSVAKKTPKEKAAAALRSWYGVKGTTTATKLAIEQAAKLLGLSLEKKAKAKK